MAGHICLETVKFEDMGDGPPGGEASKTKIVDQSVFQSVEDRDGMLSSGMEGGATELFDRLEEILKKKV